MKYIKTYENIITYPKVGYYIILDKIEFFQPESKNWQKFLNNTIGKISRVYKSSLNEMQITVEYETKDVPKELQNTFLDQNEVVNMNGHRSISWQRNFDYESTKYYLTISNNIKELDLLVSANKYNL